MMSAYYQKLPSICSNSSNRSSSEESFDYFETEAFSQFGRYLKSSVIIINNLKKNIFLSIEIPHTNFIINEDPSNRSSNRRSTKSQLTPSIPLSMPFLSLSLFPQFVELTYSYF